MIDELTNLKKILNYLSEVGCEKDLESFYHKALDRLTDLVPYDSAFMVIFDEIGAVSPSTFVKEIPDHSLREYLQYYQYIDCCRYSHFLSASINYAAWKNYDYRNNEFAFDFIRPLNYSCSSGILIHQDGELAVSCGLNRVGGRELTDQELWLLGTIQPHLNNLYTLFRKTSRLEAIDIYVSESVIQYKFLSKREKEILSLLYQRLTTSEIATKLLISRRTVEYHVMNIYEKLKVTNRRELILKLARDYQGLTPKSRAK